MDSKASAKISMEARRTGIGSEKVAQAKRARFSWRILFNNAHMLIAIPLKHAIPPVIGYKKGNSATHLARACLGGERNFTGQHIWMRGY
jgi:REP element-mobilizing transposase RayT